MPQFLEPILIIEDNEDDALFVKIAFRRNDIHGPISIVKDGVEALKYLQGAPPYEDRNRFPFPSVIYTDLKMPRMDGFGVLAWLKAHPDCSVIPTVVMTSSAEDKDVRQAYILGANSYIVKPNNLDELTRILKVSIEYWDFCLKPHITSKC